MYNKHFLNPLKHLGILFLVVIMQVVLCGCTQHSTATTNSITSSITSDTHSSSTDNNGKNSSIAPEGEILTLLTLGINRLSSSTEDGFYFLSSEKNIPNVQNIKYIDFLTRQELFLCAAPNCSHDSDSCTSYLSTNYGIGAIFTAYGKLFVLCTNQDTRTNVKMMNLDGSDAQILVTTDDMEELNLSYFAADKENFYYIRETGEIDKNGVMRFRRTLEGVHLATLQRKEIYQLSGKDFCMGSCGRNFLLRKVNSDTEQMTEYAINTDGQLVNTLFLPDNWKFNEQFIYYTNEGIIYRIVFNENCAVYAQNIRTGETRLIVDNYPADSYAFSWFGAPVNGHMPTLRVRQSENNETRNFYSLNLESGTYVPIHLTYFDSREKLVSPVAQTGELLLVVTGVAKNAQNYSSPVYTYAFIRADDYENSIPNYIEVQKLDK